MTDAIAPSPKGSFFFGHLLERRRDALGLFMRGAREHGSVVRYRMGFFESYLLTDPAHIKHVLQDNADNYRKGPIFEKMEVLIGKGLITSEGAHWRKQRRLVQPVFQRQRLASYVPLVHEVLDDAFARWDARPTGAPFEVHLEMNLVTMNIICATLFGRSALPRMREIADAGLGFIDEVSREILSLFSPLGLLLRRKAKKGPATIHLHSIIRELIEARRAELVAGSGEGGDFLSQLFASKDENGEGMNEEELLDEVLTLFVAGHETTALAVTWALYLLAQHPEEQARLREEIVRAFQGVPPSQSDLARAPRLDLVARESMRLYPPVWSFPRQAIGDDSIGGFRIPKGAFTVLSAYVMQRQPRYYRNPDEFRPDRFAEGEGADPFVYFPFGAGVRRCAGIFFAMLETELLLARFVERYRFSLASKPDVVALPLATLKPDRPIVLRLERGAK